MAYSIFTDLSDLKSVLGRAVNQSIDIVDLSPFFETTHQQRIEEWLGSDLYDSLVEAVEAASTDDDQDAVLPYYKKALAWLTLYDYIPFAEVQITGAGVSRVENDNYKTAYKNQVKAVQEQALRNGYEALEKLIIFLENNKATYTDWPAAAGYARYHAVLLHSASLFRSVYDKNISRQVFESMVGIVEDAELFALVPLLGQAQYDALLTARKTNTYTSETLEKKVILLCQKISAHFTLREALVKNYVRIENNRVVQIEYPADQSTPMEAAASTLSIAGRREMHDARANAYLKALNTYLDANEDDDALTNYKAWKATKAAAEEAYQDARTKEYGAGTIAASTSERSDWGNAFGFGDTGSSNSRKGASTL